MSDWEAEELGSADHRFKRNRRTANGGLFFASGATVGEVAAHPRSGTRGVRRHSRYNGTSPIGRNYYDVLQDRFPDLMLDIDETEQTARLMSSLPYGPMTRRESEMARSAAALQRGKDERRAGRFEF